MSAVVMSPERRASAGFRLTARGRRVVALLATLALALVFAVARGAGAARGQDAPRATVVVKQGETLDSLAATYYPDMPRFEAVMMIDRANRLNSHHVEAGQQLVIPAR